MIAVYAGSFDPPTLGHEEIIRRAAALYEKLVVLISPNSAKHGFLSDETRASLLRAVCADLNNVDIQICKGLTVEAARAAGGKVLIRSMRSVADYECEASLAWVNAGLKHGMETLFLLGKPAYSYISSTNVRELIRYGQSIEAMVPRAVFEALQPELSGRS